MPKIKFKCPSCGKENLESAKKKTLGKFVITTLPCGHTYVEKVTTTEFEKINLKDGKELWKFQVEGFHFAEISNFNCIIADQQGLGKTIQATALIYVHWKELNPILVICKGSLTIQWQKHILLETGRFAQILDSNTRMILPNLGIWIVSFDMTHKLADKIEKLKIKTVIADEIQMIKNHKAKRTNGVRKIITGSDEGPED